MQRRNNSHSDGFQKASLVSSVLAAVAPFQVCAVKKPALPQDVGSSVADLIKAGKHDSKTHTSTDGVMVMF